MRIDLGANEKPATVISRADFQQDWDRGYCALEFSPEQESVIRDARTKREIKETIPAVVFYRCMKCQFDIIDGQLNEVDGHPRTARDVMLDHLRQAKHQWPYRPFQNPYGHDADYRIEGIEHYAKEIGELDV